MRRAVSTLFNCFYLSSGSPDPITHFNAAGDIDHYWQLPIVSDDIGIGAKRDKPGHFRRVWIDRHERACHRPKIADLVSCESTTLDCFLFNLASEEVSVPLVNLYRLADHQLYLERRFISLLQELQDVSNHSPLCWGKRLHVIRRLAGWNYEQKQQDCGRPYLYHGSSIYRTPGLISDALSRAGLANFERIQFAAIWW